MPERSQQVPTSEKGDSEVYEYAEGGYGWVVLGCCVVFAACTMGWGMGSGGVYQEYYANEVFPNESTSLISLCSSFLGFVRACRSR